ncbi:MAG: cyclodeaminase/cyclohydrolase family protein, partial [Pyrinomonadaceae bacterium]
AASGAALGEMMAHLTEGRERYADVQAEVLDALAELTPLRERLEEAAHKDAASFQNVLDARSLSQETEAERIERRHRIEVALKGAATIPLQTAGAAVQVLELLETLSEVGNTNALSDAATGAQLALAAVASARYNVLVNTAEIEDEEFADEHRLRADDLLARAREIASRIEAMFLDSLQ